MRERLIQGFMRTEHAQFVQQRAEVQRIAGLRRGGQPSHPGRAERLAVQRQVVPDHLPPLAIVQRRDFQRGIAPPLQFRQRPARQRGQHQPHAMQVMRQPGQIRGLIAVLDLVQRVQHQHDADAALAARLARRRQRRFEGLTQFAGILGNRPIQLQPPVQFAQQPPQHRRPFGALRRGPDEMHQHHVAGMLLTVAPDPVGQQRRLAGTGLAQHDQRGTVARGVLVQTLHVLGPAHKHPGRLCRNAS